LSQIFTLVFLISYEIVDFNSDENDDNAACDPFSFLLCRSEKSRRERESQVARIREGNVRMPM